jgi:2-amino-4-hydroxy-6-hydroxymethyldihydropteridine diphosphokinase
MALGSNLGDRLAWLALARQRLQELTGSATIATSPEETRPLGGLDQPAYLNQMVRLQTDLDPRELMDLCHAIEVEAGRLRSHRWESRTLDLDLVRYDELLCDTPTLTLPHPGLRDRTFWAREIAELELHD